MRALILLILTGLYSIYAFPQTFSGLVIDAESKKPVSFANIGIPGKDAGTVSDVNGEFNLELNSKYDKDSIIFSCIGYESLKFSVLDFRAAGFKIIRLSPRAYELNEIVIKPVKTKAYTLGNLCDPNSCYGNSFRSGKLGTEIGVRMELPGKEEKAFLKSFRFYVGDFTFKKFPVRVNIYSVINGLPYQNILKEPIFIDITSEGEYIIDLTKYDIHTAGDFFISLEYYRVHGQDDGKLTFCAVHKRKMNKGNSYYRLSSQGNWLPEFGDKLGFSIEVLCEE